MNTKLVYKLINDEPILFFGDELNDRHDFMVIKKGVGKNVDTLLFFDSRGISKQFENSLVDQIIKALPESQSFLLVARPLEITTWMTLFNFIKLNKLKFHRIITNMGFVDFTPKKKSIIEISLDQYDLYFSKNQATVSFLEKYNTINEGEVDLFQQSYPSHFKTALEEILNSVNTIILNTPELIPGFKCARNRPSSFYSAILKTNIYNSSFNINGNVIDFEPFDVLQTYDGVHYTDKGNDYIFKRLKAYL